MKKKNFTKKEPVYYDGRHYNAQNRKYKADIPFYVSQCRKYGGPVLELACGTGRVTIPTAKEGFDITGIDISPGMLATAKESAVSAGVKINFVKTDIRKFNFRKKFKVIIFPFNAIAHLYNIVDLKSCLDCVKKHLKPNGKFIFDHFNPSLNTLTRDQSKMYPVTKYYLPERRERVTIKENNYYDRKTQINHINWHYKIGKSKFNEKLDMRIYFPQELDALLLYNGFKINYKYGYFDYTEFTSSSPRQIYICSVKK